MKAEIKEIENNQVNQTQGNAEKLPEQIDHFQLLNEAIQQVSSAREDEGLSTSDIKTPKRNLDFSDQSKPSLKQPDAAVDSQGIVENKMEDKGKQVNCSTAIKPYKDENMDPQT